MKKKVLLSMMFFMFIAACDSEISQSTPSIKIATSTPSDTAVPTRQGAPNLEGQTIRIYHFCPSPDLNDEAKKSQIAAVMDSAAYINERGGIFGALLEIELVEVASTLESVVSYKRVMRLDENPYLFLLCDRQIELALSPLLFEDEMLAIGTGQAGLQAYASGATLFSPNPIPEAHFAFWMEEIQENWESIRPDGADEEIRLAIFTSLELLPDPLFFLENSDGAIEVVWLEEIAQDGEGNIFDFIYGIRDANANAIYIQVDGSIASEFMNALNALGLRERFLVAGPSNTFDSAFSSDLLRPNYAAGIYISTAYTWWGSGNLPIAEDIFQSSGRDQSFKNGSYLSALRGLDMAIYAIEESLVAEGYQNTDSQSILQALISAQDINIVASSREANFGENYQTLSELQIHQVSEDGKVVTVYQIFSDIPDIQFPIITE